MPYANPCRGHDAPTPAREWDLPSHGALTLFFRWRKKSVQKKASGTATPEAARPAARYSQISAFRALPCPALVFAQACQSLTAFGSCIHWMPAPSRRPKTPAGTAGKAQGGLPLGNPVCLWQTELFKLNLKSSPSPSGHNRRRRLATRRCDTKRAGTTAVVPATIEWQRCLLRLRFFNNLTAEG